MSLPLNFRCHFSSGGKRRKNSRSGARLFRVPLIGYVQLHKSEDAWCRQWQRGEGSDPPFVRALLTNAVRVTAHRRSPMRFPEHRYAVFGQLLSRARWSSEPSLRKHQEEAWPIQRE